MTNHEAGLFLIGIGIWILFLVAFFWNGEAMTDEPKEPQAGEGKPIDWAKVRDDAVVERAKYFENLAKRILSHDGENLDFKDSDVRHLAEMLLLVDIAMGGPTVNSFTRFRSRYAGSY